MGEKSLVLVQEPHHKYLRALLQPAFSKEAVYSYLPAIQALVNRHLASWEAAGVHSTEVPACLLPGSAFLTLLACRRQFTFQTPVTVAPVVA